MALITKIVELLVTFLMSCQVFTSIFFLSSESDVEKFIEGEDDHFLLLRKRIKKVVLYEEISSVSIYYNKQNISWPLGDTNFIFSC